MDLTVKIRCPKCQEKFDQEIIGIVPGYTRHCPHCGATVVFTEKNVQQIRAAIERATRKV